MIRSSQVDLSGYGGATLPRWLATHALTLRSLKLCGCEALKTLPAEIASLEQLTALDISSCAALRELPSELSRLSALRTLELGYCHGLQRMPDLSGLGRLEVRATPAHLRPWDAGGRGAWAAPADGDTD